MATTSSRRVGKTRWKLAEMLATKGFTVQPGDLNSNIPYYATVEFDGCSWDGWGWRTAETERGDWNRVHFTSWDRMGDLVRHGFEITDEGNNVELHSRRD